VLLWCVTCLAWNYAIKHSSKYVDCDVRVSVEGKQESFDCQIYLYTVYRSGALVASAMGIDIDMAGMEMGASCWLSCRRLFRHRLSAW